MDIRQSLPVVASALISCAHHTAEPTAAAAQPQQTASPAETESFLEQCRKDVWENPLFQDPQTILAPDKTTDDINACVNAALDARVIFEDNFAALPNETIDRLYARARMEIDSARSGSSQTDFIQAGDCGSPDVERNPLLYTLDQLASNEPVPNPSFYAASMFAIDECIADAERAGYVPFEPDVQATLDARVIMEWDWAITETTDQFTKEDFGYTADQPPYLDGLSTLMLMQSQLEGYIDFSRTVKDILHASCEYWLDTLAMTRSEIMASPDYDPETLWCKDDNTCHDARSMGPCIAQVETGVWNYDDLVR